MPSLRRLSIVLAGMLLLVPAACQFPGAGVSLTFTSPQDGARIVGARTVTVSGSLTGAPSSALELTLNGATPITATFPASGGFAASVPLADGANTLEARASASGATATATLHLTYPYLDLTDGQNAAVAIGQTSLTASQPATDQVHLSGPAGAGALVGGNLYLPDTGNNRVVGIRGIPASTPTLFDLLLGQSRWDASTARTIGPRALSAPSGVANADGNLLVADTGNNRVLLYDGAPTVPDAPAKLAIGQAGLYSSLDTSCTAGRLDQPRSAILAGGHLIVADTAHNRVLIWTGLPTASGTAADLVLGQKDFTGCGANRGGTAGAGTLAAPGGVWSDGRRLVVADSGNHRVLIWTTFPTGNGQPADLVLGQGGMTASDPNRGGNVGAGTLSDPTSVDANGNQLFVADSGNHRVLIWNGFPASSGEPADAVLGQLDMTGSAPNAGGSAGAGTLSDPRGVRALDGQLLVADTGNARELLYLP